VAKLWPEIDYLGYDSDKSLTISGSIDTGIYSYYLNDE